MPRIALIGEFDPTSPTHPATSSAVEHSAAQLGAAVETVWVGTETLDPGLFARIDGVWIAPGGPYRDMQKTMAAIAHARRNRVPCLGTCAGFQHMVIEYARNVLGVKDAAHGEYDPYASRLFIQRMACALRGEMQLQLTAGSLVAGWYGATAASEQYYCSFGVNPEYADVLRSGPLLIVGLDSGGEIRVVELPGHPFFVGTLFVPQLRSRPDAPHPLISAFVRAVVQSADVKRR